MCGVTSRNKEGIKNRQYNNTRMVVERRIKKEKKVISRDSSS